MPYGNWIFATFVAVMLIFILAAVTGHFTF